MSSSKSVLEHAHAVLSNTLHYFLKHGFKGIRLYADASDCSRHGWDTSR